MDRITHQIRLTGWAARIQDCRSSGMTVKAWCSRNDVGEKQFYYWQRRVRQAAFNDIHESTVQNQPSFVALPSPVHECRDLNSSLPALVLRSGTYSLEIHSEVPDALLVSVLRVIAHVE